MKNRFSLLVGFAALGLVLGSRPAAAEGAAPPLGLDLRALIQTDWIVHRESSQDTVDPSTRAPLNDDRFLLRRARLRASAESSFVGGWFELDANTLRGFELRPFEALAVVGYPTAFAAKKREVSGLGDLSPRGSKASSRASDPDADENSARDSWLDAVRTRATVSLSAGLLAIPFGFEVQEPVTRRPVLERARFGTAFFGQGRDLGMVLNGSYEVVRLAVGVTNGEPLGTVGYPGLDATRGKDWVGRLGVSWPVAPWLELHAGGSWLTGVGLSPGTGRSKDSVTWVDDNENGLIEVVELTPASGAPATGSETFSRNAFGADGRVRVRLGNVGPLEFRAEVVRAQNLDRTVEPADPIAAGRELRELGWALGVSQSLFGIGELAVRYDVYDPDADATRLDVANAVPADRTYRTLSVATAVRLFGARFIWQYDWEDNRLGRGPGGAPARLRDDRLTLRAEVVLP